MDRLPGLKGKFSTILADPPWQFQNRTGKVAPEHKRLKRYQTMTLDQILAMPVECHAADQSHLYLWVPNALLEEGLAVSGLGASPTSPTLFGIKFVKTAGRMVAALDSISAM